MNEESWMGSWVEMKRLLQGRFVPSYHCRDIHNKLQRLTYGNNSVHEYYKEMQVSLIRVSISLDRDVTMSRFL